MKKSKEKLYLDLSFIRGTKSSVIIGINTEEIDEWKQYLLKKKGQKKIRFVKDWVWWNIKEDEECNEICRRYNLKPSAIYSHNLLWDESGKFTPGWSLRTGFLERFEERCLFITSNTIYVLVGLGRQSDVTLKEYDSVRF